MKALTVTFQDGVVSVKNDGNGIPVIKNVESGKWNPSVCLGRLLSNTNYDDTKERLGGGRNGVGSAVATFGRSGSASGRAGRTPTRASDGLSRRVEGQHESRGVSKSERECKEERDRDDSDVLPRLRTVWRGGGEWPFLETLLRHRLYDIAATTPLRVTFNKVKIDLPNIANVKRTKNLAAYAMLLGTQQGEVVREHRPSMGVRCGDAAESWTWSPPPS